MTFQGLYDQIEQNQQAILNDDVNFLPLYHAFPSLKNTLPGLIRKEQLVVTGSTGTGKTKLTHFLLNTILNLKPLKPKLKVQIIYNTLEESVEKFKSMYVVEYLSNFGEEVTYYQLLGYSETPLTSRQLDLAKEATEYYETVLEPNLELVTMSSTVEFYNHVVEKMKQFGEFVDVVENGKLVKKFQYYDPNQWVIVVSDHIGCYRPEQGKTLFDTLQHFCITLSRVNLGLRYGCINILVQQQIKAKDQIEANIKPKTFIEKVKPSLDGLALYKNSSDDATIVIGIFDPHKWKEHLVGANYNGINLNDVERSGLRLRSLCFLKTREGVLEDKEMVVYFNGATNQFTEINRF